MKITHLLKTLPLTLLIFGCQNQPAKTQTELKAEILQAEKDFQKMTAEKGVAEAFYAFADENAVIKRGNDSLIMGRDNIKHFYVSLVLENAEVTWLPDSIYVSQSGDLAYTYGKYLWKENRNGSIQESKGVFHTVWKRQSDGSWKYVWD